MRRLFRVVLVLALCFLQTQCIAQIRTDTLQGVEISTRSQSPDVKERFQPGLRTVALDSATLERYRQKSLATLLEQTTSVFIRSYGFNSMATISLRGASAAQSAVFWQGVPLMNAATGVTDLSLLPLAFADSIRLQYGSSGALGGSGQVGGALILQSKSAEFSEKTDWTFAGHAGLGSFGQVPLSAEIGLKTKRFSIRVRGLSTQAENDFPTRDAQGNSVRMPNAAMKGIGLLTDIFFQASRKDLVSLHYWQQGFQREIPPALFESVSLKKQEDQALRLLLEWKHTGALNHYSRMAFLRDQYEYDDASIHLNTKAATQHFFGEWGARGRLSSGFQWLIFAPVQYMKLEGRPEDQFRVALAGSLLKSFRNQHLDVSATGRVEYFGEKWIGLPGLSASYLIDRYWQLRASVQKSYRMPGLNELYYNPGGNPNLKPENGWSVEGGYSYSRTWNEKWTLRHSLDGYARWINDWIIWLGGAIWTPHNLAAVYSRGFQTDNELSWRKGDWRARFGLGIAFTRATPTESYLPNDQSVGKQIPYTPEWTSSGSLGISWRSWDLSFIERINGVRYITVDESSWLNPYHLGTLILSYSLHRSLNYWQLQAMIQNIWNDEYKVVAYRPMPGINYLLGISVKLH